MLMLILCAVPIKAGMIWLPVILHRRHHLDWHRKSGHRAKRLVCKVDTLSRWMRLVLCMLKARLWFIWDLSLLK